MSKPEIDVDVRPKPPIVQTIWLEKEFDKLHKEHLLILNRLNEIHVLLIGSADTPIIPELEKQVLLAGKIATKIDRKVEDLPPSVPPGTGTGSPSEL